MVWGCWQPPPLLVEDEKLSNFSVFLSAQPAPEPSHFALILFADLSPLLADLSPLLADLSPILA